MRKDQDHSVQQQQQRGDGENIDLQEGTLENAYDHSNCHDCACVPELTLDCVQHFNKLSAQGIQMTQRLQSIVELREQIKDFWGSQTGPSNGYVNSSSQSSS